MDLGVELQRFPVSWASRKVSSSKIKFPITNEIKVRKEIPLLKTEMVYADRNSLCRPSTHPFVSCFGLSPRCLRNMFAPLQQPIEKRKRDVREALQRMKCEEHKAETRRECGDKACFFVCLFFCSTGGAHVLLLPLFLKNSTTLLDLEFPIT